MENVPDKGERRELSTVRPRSMGTSRFSLTKGQNVLEYQVDFPQYHYPGDRVQTEWSDRIWSVDPKEHDRLRKKHLGDGGQHWDRAKPEQTKRFLEDYLGHSIDGFRCVRQTNVSSGHPLWRFDIYRRGEDSPEQPLYSGQDGPLVRVDAPAQ